MEYYVLRGKEQGHNNNAVFRVSVYKCMDYVWSIYAGMYAKAIAHQQIVP